MVNLLRLSLIMAIALFISCKSKTTAEAENNKGYEFEMKSAITQEVAGMDTSTMNIQSFYNVKFAGEEKGLTVVELTYKEMVVKMDMMGMNVDVDTRRAFVDSTETDLDLPEMMARIFYGVKGKTIRLLVNKDGELNRIDKLDELKQAITGDTSIPAAFKESWTMMFDQQFNEENLKNQFQRFFIAVPADKRKAGGNWVKQTLPAGMTYDSHYTVSSVDKEKANLSVESTLRANDVSAGVTGNEKGTLTVQMNTGLVTQSNSISTIDQKSTEGTSVMKIETTVSSKPL